MLHLSDYPHWILPTERPTCEGTVRENRLLTETELDDDEPPAQTRFCAVCFGPIRNRKARAYCSQPCSAEAQRGVPKVAEKQTLEEKNRRKREKRAAARAERIARSYFEA